MGKNVLRLLFLILPFMVISISCQKDNLDEVANQDILEARMWFEITYSPNLIIDSKNSARKKAISVPNWDHAKAFFHKESKTIEVPLISDGEFGFASKESFLAFQATGEKRYLESRTYLIIESEKGNKRGFLMTIIPEKSFKLKKNFEAFRSTYRKWENDFNGSVLYHELDGPFTNGWRITEGRSTNRILNDGENGIPTIVSKGCWAAYLVSWTYTCEQSDKGISVGSDVIAQSADCKYYEEWEYLYTVCDDDGGGGGGSGEGEYDPGPQIIDAIYDPNSTLSPREKRRLEAAVNEFIEHNPIYALIWQRLLTNNVRLVFHINPSIQSNAEISGNILTFRDIDEITRVNVGEELIHRAQKLTYGEAMVSIKRNFEFEAKLVQDLATLNNEPWRSMITNGFADPIDNGNYIMWLTSLWRGEILMDASTLNYHCNRWFYPNPANNYSDPNFVPLFFIDIFSGNNGGGSSDDGTIMY